MKPITEPATLTSASFEDLVREYEKGEYVALDEEDFDKIAIETTKTISIMDFVDQDDIDPMFFDQPYYLEAQKGGDRAYALLRQALVDSGKVGIAKVVIRTRQHVAVAFKAAPLPKSVASQSEPPDERPMVLYLAVLKPVVLHATLNLA